MKAFYYRWIIRTALLTCCALAGLTASASISIPAVPSDSLFLFNKEDTTRRFNPFWIITLTDSSKQVQKEVKTRRFYKKIKDIFSQSRLTRELFDLLFVEPSAQKQLPSSDLETIERYEQQQEKIIGDIKIRKLELFGPTVTDTTKKPKGWIQKTLNNLHTPTQNYVIRKNLFFEKGDQVSPQQLADNERIIRSLSFIRDARIHLIPRGENSDTVDVLVLTQDVLPYMVGGRFGSIKRFSLNLRNNNIGGIGHELSNEIIYNRVQTPNIGYRGAYIMPNLGGKFLNGRLEYAHSEFEKNIGGNLQRTFYTPEVRWAGGLQINRTTLKRGHLFLDQSFDSLFYYKFDHINVWGAHAFQLWEKKGNAGSVEERSRIVVAARFASTDYLMRPKLNPNELHYFHDSRLYLASIGWSHRQYYRDYYLFGFGRTEDIPYGGLVNFTFGHEDREFENYKYASLRLARGAYIWRFGYLYGQLDLGSYFHKNRTMERRQFRFLTNYYSPLWKIGNYSFRQFLSFDYLYGDRRYDYEFLHIGYDNIRGLTTLQRRGTQRFSLRFQTVGFTPLYFLGFRFAGFAFADLAFLNTSKFLHLQGEDFHGYGLGLRVRNENLTFNTFQIRFSVYPSTPGKSFGISISTIPSQIFNDFRIEEPQPLEFR